ncbi:hypothetical protein J2TS4_38650 [Paenibacillus sp. J2TS4]|nr:hypothetical protein J2TS4_38650 [Paenibacillus sp. J2TS4]
MAPFRIQSVTNRFDRNLWVPITSVYKTNIIYPWHEEYELLIHRIMMFYQLKD